MLILGINHILNHLQITTGGRRYTCPLKEIDGELFFAFKNQWHKVAEYLSEYTDEMIEEGGKIITRRVKR